MRVLMMVVVYALVGCGSRGPQGNGSRCDDDYDCINICRHYPSDPFGTGFCSIPQMTGGQCTRSTECESGQCTSEICEATGGDGSGGSGGTGGGGGGSGGSGGTGGTGSGNSGMRWWFDDWCSDGQGAEIRLFDKTNNLVWPNSSEVYVVPVAGRVNVNIACSPGAKICYGAQAPGRSGRWGIGIDGTDGCDGCCYSCALGTEVEFNLKCN